MFYCDNSLVLFPVCLFEICLQFFLNLLVDMVSGSCCYCGSSGGCFVCIIFVNNKMGMSGWILQEKVCVFNLVFHFVKDFDCVQHAVNM